jgi:hypothetical protein
MMDTGDIRKPNYMAEISSQVKILLEWIEGQFDSCLDCGARIAWCKDTSGYDYPMDRDGKNHFSVCSRFLKRNRWKN